MRVGVVGVLFFVIQFSYAVGLKNKRDNNRKGDSYVYWGWNRGFYSDSDIYFKGDDYDFTLKNVVAKDRQSPFNANTYFNPAWATIPQYDFRIGYYITNKYDISAGIDHMKYVMVGYQTVKIDGEISSFYPDFEGDYNNEDFDIDPDFLRFEHTDGLNYANVELRRTDEIIQKGKFSLSLIHGGSVGVLVPRTNAKFMGRTRHDEFHLSGYGFAGVVALNITYNNRWFIQSELKEGFINMPNIRITYLESDKASQKFWFTQSNVVVGMYIGVNRGAETRVE